ncbi:hypothetical protein F5148DRAFT_460829 [Russula earlei]|uniref:Uncharacterized protein n=1 Tax=Russula earlei TaxID=71964 RepID=A0ACC0TYN3_9AGAM|nr:hypothetical protein F5148DRAFT_460829 [Russula earlei]
MMQLAGGRSPGAGLAYSGDLGGRASPGQHMQMPVPVCAATPGQDLSVRVSVFFFCFSLHQHRSVWQETGAFHAVTVHVCMPCQFQLAFLYQCMFFSISCDTRPANSHTRNLDDTQRFPVTSGMKCKHQAPHEEWRAHGSWLPPALWGKGPGMDGHSESSSACLGRGHGKTKRKQAKWKFG